VKEKLLAVWEWVVRFVQALFGALKVALVDSVKTFMATMKKEVEA